MQQHSGINSRAGPENALYTLLSKHLPLLAIVPKLQATSLQDMTTLTYAGILIYFLQLIGFVVNPHYPWGVIISTGLDQAIFSTHVPAYDGYFSAYTTSTGLQVVIWVTVGLLIAAMLPVVYRRDSSHTVADAVVAANEAAATGNKAGTGIETFITIAVGSLFRSVSTWLIVPMAHWACAAWTCKDGSLPATVGYLNESQQSCFTGSHIAAIVGAILLALLVIPVILAFTAVDAVTNPLSVHPRARAHTVVDNLVVLQLVVVTALFHVGDAFGALQVPAAALAITSTLMAVAFAYMIPYYNHTTNRVYCAIHVCAAVVGVIGFFAAQFNTPGSIVGRSPTTLLISAFPLSLVAGWCLPDARIATRWQQLLLSCDQGLDATEDRFDATALQDLDFDRHQQCVPTMHVAGLDDNTPWLLTDDELDAARDTSFDQAKKKELDLFFEDDDRVSHDSSASSNASHGGGGPRADGQDPDQARKRRLEIQQLVSRTSAVIKACMASPYITTARIATDVELATRFVTSYRRKFCLPAPQNLRDACSSLFNRGLFKFSSSAIVPIHFALYVSKSDTSRCSSALQLLERVPSLDPTIFDLVRCAELRLDLRAALGILDHTYEHHMGRAAELHTEALRRMHAFWLKLMEPSVDLASAAEVADELHAVRRKALERFRSALEAQRGGLDVDFAKKLGLFMSEVMLDNGAATECEAVATELAKRVSKRRNAVDAEMATRLSRLSVVIGGDDEASNANGGGSDRARKTSLLHHMSFVFAALILCLAALLGISVLTSSVDHVLTDRVVHANKLRTLPYQAVYTILEYQQDIASSGVATTSTSSTYSTRLLSIVSDLETSLRNVVEDTSGATAYVARLDRGKLVSDIQVSTGPTGRIMSTSFWLTMTVTIDELRRVATAMNTSSISTVAVTLNHLQNHVTSTSAETVSRQLSLWLEEHANAQEVSTAVAVLIVLCGIVITLLAVAALLHNFRVAAETKFLTFQLFTLIPFDSLELLATATKNKIDDREAAGKATGMMRGAGTDSSADGTGSKEGDAADAESDDDGMFDTASPPTDLPPGPGQADGQKSPALGAASDTESRRPSGDDAKRRQSTSSKKSRDPKSWRGMLANATRVASPKSVLKQTVFGVEPNQATKKSTGPRVVLNPEVTIVAPPPADDADDKAALTGKAAANMLLALQKSTSASSTPEASASSISLAEKTGELDLEAIKAGEQWRVANNVYPTKVVGGSNRRRGNRRVKEEPTNIIEMAYSAKTDYFFRFFAQYGNIAAAIAFIIAFPTLISEPQGLSNMQRVDGAIDAVTQHYLTQASTSASYVFDPVPSTLMRDQFLSYRASCGVPLVAEPLFNCTSTAQEADVVVEYVDALNKLISAQSDAVVLADYAYMSLGLVTKPGSYAIGNLKNVTAILARRASLHQAISDAYTLTNLAVQQGATVPSTGLAQLLREAARRILESAAVGQYATQARAALRDAAKVLSKTQCDKVLSTSDTRMALAVARWLAVTAVSCKVISLLFASGHGLTWGTFRHAVGITFISTNVALFATVAIANDAASDAIMRSCRAIDASGELAMLQINSVRAVQHFVASSDRSSWAAYRTLTPERLTAGTLDSVSELLPYIPAHTGERLQHLLSIAQQPTNKLRSLDTVAVTLTWIARQQPLALFNSSSLGVAYVDPLVLPDASTNGFVNSVSWNSLDDPSITFDVSTFYGGNPLLTITNRSFDLFRWNGVQKQQAAIALVHDARYEYYVSQMQDATLNLKTELRNAWSNYASEVLSYRFSVAIAALVIGTVSSIVIASWHFPSLVRQMYGDLHDEFWTSNDEKNSSAMERIRSAPAFRTALQKSYLAVSIIMALLFAALGVAVYEARANDLVPQYLEAGGLRSLLVAQSLADLLRGSTVDVDGTTCALRATAALVREGNDAWVNFGSLTLGALGIDSTVDELNWGPSSNAPYESDAAAYVTSQCGVVSQPSTTQSYGPFGALGTMPLQIALRQWRALVTEYASASAARQATLLPTIEALAEQLVQTSLSSDTALADAANKRVNTAAVALQVICALTIALVLFLYQWLVVPLSRQLIGVQQDTLLMLQVVPPDVRDLVPAITEYMETGTMDTAAEIRRKLEMNESLLKNILPENISRRLKSGESPIADMHPSITIVFTDFVGFTSISSGLSAEEIVDFLNEVFVEFDLISEMLKLDKIKTIGDAYFMTGGLDPTVTDHAMRVIEASIFMFEALSDHNAKHRDRKPLRMRLGVHTGPAIAGVIGTKKVAYDLWGPNVGIANGMEASGVPGRIHISDATLAHVRGYYAFEPRGELPHEKGVPDVMPSATFLFTGRLVPTPYQFLRRPRNDPRQQQQVQAQRAAAAAAAAAQAAAAARSE